MSRSHFLRASDEVPALRCCVGFRVGKRWTCTIHLNAVGFGCKRNKHVFINGANALTQCRMEYSLYPDGCFKGNLCSGCYTINLEL